MDYLVIKNNRITQICTTDEDLLKYLEINITDDGIVEITKDGRQLPMSYSMESYTKEEALKDVIRCHLKRIECMLQIGIYKLVRI